MNSFVSNNVFSKRAEDSVLDNVKSFLGNFKPQDFSPVTNDNFDALSHSDDSLKNLLQHATTHSVLPAAIGAGIGASSNKNKGRNALLGGLVGFGGGAIGDMYQLANNQRNFEVDSRQQELSLMDEGHPLKDKIKHNLDAWQKAHWYDLYSNNVKTKQ